MEGPPGICRKETLRRSVDPPPHPSPPPDSHHLGLAVYLSRLYASHAHPSLNDTWYLHDFILCKMLANSKSAAFASPTPADGWWCEALHSRSAVTFLLSTAAP